MLYVKSIFRRKISLSTKLLKSIIPFNLADIGEGIREVVIKEWFINENQAIKQFDPICEVQSDKASVTISSRYDGIVKKIYSLVDETVFVGKPLIDIEVEDKINGEMFRSPPMPPINSFEIDKTTGDKSGELAKAIPMIRKLAKDLGVDIENVKGTGKEGRITEQDVMNFKRGSKPLITDANLKQLRGDIENIKGARKVMIKSMNKSLEIPQFVLTELIVSSSLLNFKNALAQELNLNQSKTTKMTIMPILIKTASIALTKYPILNCRFNDQEEKIHYQPFHNIGVAVDTECQELGLVVPNIKNVQNLSIRHITEELQRLIQDCKDSKKPKIEDLQNGTFTISNIGAIGGIHAKPIVMWPEVSIAAIGKIYPQIFLDQGDKIETDITSYSNKQLKLGDLHKMLKPVFYISVSADHRVIDGATVAKFLNYWKHILENPASCIAIDAI